ncbi:hypothetical protein M758_7G008300 [Ceratodon purpureus]|uniref:Uncharacterized protein n=1 Tax=Ceratodon purpureus TaxID=3225 RepID=A0A8T0H3C1_CERPU|nr:hypothetical protein KC19_7G008900 [Ceratodon purpureus]KAG0609710.1 hypothetical protein M758_7G008300 [Ceratodon purpureus]
MTRTALGFTLAACLWRWLQWWRHYVCYSYRLPGFLGRYLQSFLQRFECNEGNGCVLC